MKMRKCISFLTAVTVMVTMMMQLSVAHAEAVEISTESELVSAVTNGGTYRIADGTETLDCSDKQLQVRKDIDMDLNGANIIIDNDGFNLQNFALTVTIKNGTITARESGSTYGVKTMAKTPSVVNLEDVVISGVKNGVASANSYTTINIKGGSISGTAAGIAGTMGYFKAEDTELSAITLANESTLELINSTVNSTGSGITGNGAASATITGSAISGNTNNYGIYWAASGNLDITNSSVTVNANGKGVVHGNNSTANITVTDCTFTNTCETAAKAYLFTSNSGDSSSIIVDGGTYRGINNINASSQTSLTIKSGLFSSDPSKYLEEGKAALLNGEEMYEVVDASEIPDMTPAPTADPSEPTQAPTAAPTQAPPATQAPLPSAPVWEGDPTEITNAEELASAVLNGGFYKVADGIETIDCSEKTLKVNKSVEIDLNGAEVIVDNDGFNFQASSMYVTLKNGTVSAREAGSNYGMKIMGKTVSVVNLENLDITGVKNGIAAANAYSEINIKDSDISGTVVGINGAMGYITVEDSQVSGITLANESTLSLDNTVVNGIGNGITGNGASSATVNGGSISGTTNAFGVYWASSGDLSMTGASVTVDSNGKGAVHGNNSSGKITIKNCNISNTCETAAKAYLFTSNSGDAATISVDGGIYTGVNAINGASQTTLTIKSGTFSSDPSKYVLEGSTVEETDSGFVVSSDQNAPSYDVTYENGVFKAEFTNVDTSGTVYIAQYNANKVLIAIKSIPLTASIEEEIEKKSDDIRVFVWGMGDKPLFGTIRP